MKAEGEVDLVGRVVAVEWYSIGKQKQVVITGRVIYQGPGSVSILFRKRIYRSIPYERVIGYFTREES